MDNKEWFKSLKDGDEVAALIHSRHCKNFYKVLKVSKVTPKGFIRLENGDLLKNCTWHSLDKWSGSWYEIEPLTEEIKNKILEHRKRSVLTRDIRSKLRETNLDELSTSELVELYKALD